MPNAIQPEDMQNNQIEDRKVAGKGVDRLNDRDIETVYCIRDCCKNGTPPRKMPGRSFDLNDLDGSHSRPTPCGYVKGYNPAT